MMITIQEKYIDEAMYEYKLAQEKTGFNIESNHIYGHPIFSAMIEECFEEILDNKEYFDNLSGAVKIEGEKYNNIMSAILVNTKRLDAFIIPVGTETSYIRNVTKISLIVNESVTIDVYYNEYLVYLNMNGSIYVYDYEDDEILFDSLDNEDYDFIYFFLKLLIGSVSHKYVDNVVEFANYQ